MMSDSVLGNISRQVYDYSLEPTSEKGLNRYIDLYSMLPRHIQQRDDLMKNVFMFQDYLNDGYRLIPEPVLKYTYKVKNSNVSDCGNGYTQYSVIEYARPLNHNTSMYMKSRENSNSDNWLVDEDSDKNSAKNWENVEAIEEYDRFRDLSTFAIDETEFEKYKENNSEYLFSYNKNGLYSYFNEPRVWSSGKTFYKKFKQVVNKSVNAFKNGTAFVAITNVNVENKSILSESQISKQELIDLIENNIKISDDYSILPSNILIDYYACDYESFINNFSKLSSNENVKFSANKDFFEYLYGVSDGMSYVNQYDDYSTISNMSYSEIKKSHVNYFYNKSIRFTLSFKNMTFSQILEAVNNFGIFGGYALKIQLNDISKCEDFFNGLCTTTIVYGVTKKNYYSFIGPSLTVIHKYEHPQVFYDAFGSQNEYRIKSKGYALADKIYRLAYCKDPNIVDYEYINLVAQEFGYDMGLDEDAIDENSYYALKEDKQNVIRNIIKGIPEYIKIKGTSNSIENVLLSFGLVTKIINLYTIADETQKGYTKFMDSRIVSGNIKDFFDYMGISPEDATETDYANAKAQLAAELLSNPDTAGTLVSDWYPSPHFRVQFNLLKDNINYIRNSFAFKSIKKAIIHSKPINTVFDGFYATMTSKAYGLIFAEPVGLMQVFQDTNNYGSRYTESVIACSINGELA